jgi:hypothetical protein
LRLRKKRAINLTIAITMLAVPASAVALASTAAVGQSGANPTASGSSLHLRVAPKWIQYNHAVTVTGRAPATDTGHTIELETAASRDSGWRTVQATKIGRGGRFRLVAALRRSSLIRVVQTPAGSTATVASAAAAGPGVAASAPRPVAVRAQLRVHPRSRELLGGGAVQVRGKLLPARAGRMVRLQDHSPAGWRTLTTSRTGTTGSFRLRAAPASGVQRRLRVLFAGDQVNARTVRPAGRVTVYRNQSVASWYDDSGSTACGFHAGLGVANRSLPCGTKVRFRYGGRSVTAVVDDRGPFVGGRDWDLNQNTAAALGFGGVGTVWTTQ